MVGTVHADFIKKSKQNYYYYRLDGGLLLFHDWMENGRPSPDKQQKLKV